MYSDTHFVYLIDVKMLIFSVRHGDHCWPSYRVCDDWHVW